MTARNTGAPPVPARALARHRACVRSDARRPNPASSEDGTSSHGSVAARPIEKQRETQGSPPFLRARSRYATCMSAGLRVRGDARMLAPAKPHIRRGWDLVSRIGCSKTHRMAVISSGRSPFPRARSLCTIHVLSAGRLQRCADARPGQSTHQARMGLGLTDWSHQHPSNGSKKARGALHFRARACYAMCMSGVDAILKSE